MFNLIVKYAPFIYKLISFAMKKKKGLLSKDHEAKLAEWLDEKIKFKNFLIERFDRTAFKIMIASVDNLIVDKVPEAWRNPLEPIIDALFEDHEKAIVLAAELVNSKLDIPGIEEIEEQKLIEKTIHWLSQMIITYLKK